MCLNYKEDRWQFYAKGPINSIEETNLQKQKKLRTSQQRNPFALFEKWVFLSGI